MNKLMPQHPERLRKGQEYENAGGSKTSPHPAGTEHERRVRKIFGHPHRGKDTSPGAFGTPWNRRVGDPIPLEVIHGTTQGVDRRLLTAVSAGAADLPPGYKVKVFSGFRSGDPGAHGRGQAIYVEIVDPKGDVIPSRGEDKTGMYRRLARATYAEMKARDPDLAENKFAWGGSFGTQKGGGGVSDLMHFDIMKRRGGIRASHYPQVQDMGALPLERRTVAAYAGHDTTRGGARKESQRAKFGHPHVVGHHPATIGRAENSVTVQDNTGGLVTVSQ